MIAGAMTMTMTKVGHVVRRVEKERKARMGGGMYNGPIAGRAWHEHC